MQSRETLERYRRMSNAERFKISLQMIDEAWPHLFRGTPEQVARRFELLRRQNDERNLRMMEAIARVKHIHEPP